MRPKRLAEGAAIPEPPARAKAASSAAANGCDGTRSPTLSWPLQQIRYFLQAGQDAARPGLKAPSFLRAFGHRACPVDDGGGIGEMHDHWMIGGAPFGREDTLHGVGVARVGAEAVDGLRRKCNELAAVQKGRRAPDHSRRGRDDIVLHRQGRTEPPAAQRCGSARGRNLLEFKLLHSVGGWLSATVAEP